MMKKFSSRLLLLILVLITALGLASCGIRKKPADTESRKEQITNEENPSLSEDKEGEDASSEDSQSEQDSSQKNEGTALYKSVADYVNSDAMKTALDSMKSTYANEAMSIDLVAEGENKLVYVFMYNTITHTEGDGMKEALESAIGTQDAVFQQTADSIKPFVSCDEVMVEIRYVDKNGTVIFSKTYVAK